MKQIRILAVFVLAAVTPACVSSNAALYKKADATATYFEASYKGKCQHTGGHFPASCGPCEAVLARAAWQVQAAKTNVQIGYMDPREVAELQQLVVDLQVCP